MNSTELRIKAQGVKECVKWVKEKLKTTQLELDHAGYGDDYDHIRSRFNAQLEIKIELEKYAKKLLHEANEAEEY